MTAIAEYIDAEKLELLLAKEEVVVVDFTASWCGPCKVVGPYMDELAEEFSEKATLVKLDIDENKDMTKSLGVRSIPAIIYFKQGKEAIREVGVKPIEHFREQLKSLLV